MQRSFWSLKTTEVLGAREMARREGAPAAHPGGVVTPLPSGQRTAGAAVPGNPTHSAGIRGTHGRHSHARRTLIYIKQNK